MQFISFSGTPITFRVFIQCIKISRAVCKALKIQPMGNTHPQLAPQVFTKSGDHTNTKPTLLNYFHLICIPSLYLKEQT